jgi:agmatinase
MVDALDELKWMLRPAGGGLFLVSTGRAEQLELQRSLYGVDEDHQVEEAWKKTLARIEDARVVVLGIPSDVGAGFVRGANLGPQHLRQHWMKRRASLSRLFEEEGIVDIGDVFVVPQLLHDDMLSEAQRKQSSKALYPDLKDEVRAALPVSPLSIAERAFDRVFELNAQAKCLMLGGDHSTAWPLTAAIHRHRQRHQMVPWAIVQFDAHTDLLAERLGVPYCFATWSYHANELLERNGKLVQLGIRATRHPRSHWEGELGVRQFWADECLAHPDSTVDTLVEELRERGVQAVYVSNDIDGTDEKWADATGTPESGGLTPDFVQAVIRRLGTEFDLMAGDLVEVAPPLLRKPDSAQRTLDTGVDYLESTLAALLGKAPADLGFS